MRTHITNADLRLDSGRTQSHDRGTSWVAASVFTGWPPDIYWDIFLCGDLADAGTSDPLFKMVNVYHNEEEDFLLPREAWLHFCWGAGGATAKGSPQTEQVWQKHELALRLYLASTPTTTSIAEHKTLAKLKKKQI